MHKLDDILIYQDENQGDGNRHIAGTFLDVG